jgi:hypothetical protein
MGGSPIFKLTTGVEPVFRFRTKELQSHILLRQQVAGLSMTRHPALPPAVPVSCDEHLPYGSIREVLGMSGPQLPRLRVGCPLALPCCKQRQSSFGHCPPRLSNRFLRRPFRDGDFHSLAHNPGPVLTRQPHIAWALPAGRCY